jgi:cobalt-precorrin 5A hydrolase
MSIAVITFSNEGLSLAKVIKGSLPDCTVFVHAGIQADHHAVIFTRIYDRMQEIFSLYKGIVFIGPCGIAVRAIAPYIGHKTTDPAVVVIDVGGRFAVSLLSGHEGGANELAVQVANCIGAEPCISTTTEAVKTITAGIGCRKNSNESVIIEALHDACKIINTDISKIRTIATAEIKRNEPGLIAACKKLDIPLRIIPDWQMKQCTHDISSSDFVKETTGLPGVAEPAALVSGRNTKLILRRHVFQGVTVALAQEHCMWSE